MTRFLLAGAVVLACGVFATAGVIGGFELAPRHTQTVTAPPPLPPASAIRDMVGETIRSGATDAGIQVKFSFRHVTVGRTAARAQVRMQGMYNDKPMSPVVEGTFVAHRRWVVDKWCAADGNCNPIQFP